MRKFNPTLVVLMLFFAAALQADSVTVLETSDPSALTYFFNSYDVPTSSAPVTAEIILSAGCSLLCVQYPTASIDFTMDLYTAGPVRDGILFLRLGLNSDADANTSTPVSGAVGPYSIDYCPRDIGCYLNGYFPFTLGVPFTIDLSGSVWVYQGNRLSGGGDITAWASVQLYELPDSGQTGAPVEIYLVPEPSSMVTAGTGLAALILYAAARLFSSATSASQQTWKTPK